MNNYHFLFNDSNLSFFSIFICITVCFYILKRVYATGAGPGYWCLSYFFNSIGFLLWSGVLNNLFKRTFLAGEIFHVAGFFFLVMGIYRFCGYKFKKWNIIFIAAWIFIWAYSIVLVIHYKPAGLLMAKLLRAVLFIGSGVIILKKKNDMNNSGKYFSAVSLFLWGVFIIISGFMNFGKLFSIGYGLLVGFQIIATFGMIIMLLQNMASRVEEDESRIRKLEGILPICSHCKKIRDKHDKWQTLELYIADNSEAEFSHGICPDCLKKHYPDYAGRT